MTTVRGMSFHSVKGGVGKSTLAVVAAVQLAAAHQEAPVILIDMDLTGTSLADVLQLRAPRWQDNGPVDLARLERVAPDGGFHDRTETRRRIEGRADALRASRGALPTERHAPFLNDFLLHTPTDRGDPRDVLVESLLWELDPSLENLRVVPSSAIPGDLERIMPVIFDEQHAAFLEARLEILVDALIRWQRGHPRWKEAGELHLVVDVPPTIPGLSRTVMSLGLRLSAPGGKEELSEDGGTPLHLKGATVLWRIHLVATLDVQDLRATLRWTELVSEAERDRFRLLINRVEVTSTPGNREVQVQSVLSALGKDASPGAILQGGPLVDEATFVEDHIDLRLFREESPVGSIARHVVHLEAP